MTFHARTKSASPATTRLRGVALPRHQRRLRCHGRRHGRDQGAGHRPLRAPFQAAGFCVLAIDFRRHRRQRRHAAADRARPRPARRLRQRPSLRPHASRGRPGDASRSGDSRWPGGHVFRAAAADSGTRGAIAQTPLADGPAIAPNAMRSMTPRAALRLNARPARRRRPPRRPRAAAGPAGWPARHRRHADHARRRQGRAGARPRQQLPGLAADVAAGSALRMAFYRPGRVASRTSDARCWCWPAKTIAAPCRAPPARAPRAPRRGRPPARRPLRAVHGRLRAGGGAPARLPAPASHGRRKPAFGRCGGVSKEQAAAELRQGLLELSLRAPDGVVRAAWVGIGGGLPRV